MTTPPTPAVNTPVHKAAAHGSTVLRDRLSASLQQLFAFAALIIVYIFFSFAAPNFGTWSNFGDILLGAAVTGVMALGATFVIATSGIDLSVGTGMALCAVICGMLLAPDRLGLPLPLGLLLTLLFGAFLGFVNGFNVSILGIPPFIATLAMMLVAQGLALVLTKAQPIRMTKVDGFTDISQAQPIPGLPMAAVIFLIATGVAAVVMGKTLLGRFALALGSNEEATRLSGIDTRSWKIAIYTVAGVFTALSAILITARSGSAYPGTGLGYELEAIAAVVIGGTSLAGGRATIIGSLIGALLMQMLAKGLQLMSIPQEWQKVAIGVVILVAVYADNLRRERENSV